MTETWSISTLRGKKDSEKMSKGNMKRETSEAEENTKCVVSQKSTEKWLKRKE